MISILINDPEDCGTKLTIKYLKNFSNLSSVASKGIQIKIKYNIYETINARKQGFLKIPSKINFIKANLNKQS